MSAPLTLAWHYTKGIHLQRILGCGFLHPASAGVYPPEKPVLWFSLNQHLEPTAIPSRIDSLTGKQIQLTEQEAIESYGQFARFGVSPRLLLSGDALRKKARIKTEIWRGLVRAAIDQGADPGLWFGFVGAMAVNETVIEQMNLAGAWEPLKLEGRA